MLPRAIGRSAQNYLITNAAWNDGFDTIQFGAGISASDLVYSYANNNNGLKITIAAQGSITIDSEFPFDTQSQIDQLRFADGTVLSRQQFINAALAQMATPGPDSLIGSNGDDAMNGGAGNDRLDPRNGNDIVTGGPGNDTLVESGGNDTYIYNLGDGDDVITGGAWNDGFDTIQFGAGISASDLVYSYPTNNAGLKITVAGQGSITIDSELNYDTSSQVDQLKFADGTVLTRQQFINAALAQLGTPGADSLVGSNGDDIVNGGAGADRIDPRAGKDVVTGGAGNDTLVESGGNDTYIWNLGDGDDVITGGFWNDGFDTIQFGAGIAASDLTYSYANNNNGLKITVAGQGSITIDAELVYDTSSQIDQLKFADGTVLTRQQLINAALAQIPTAGADSLVGSSGSDVVNGGAGDDTIDGRGGDDTITGGPGNDLLIGGSGNDTYLFNRGDGQDTIREWYSLGVGGTGGTDTIQFGAGIAPSDVFVSKTNGGNDLVLSLAESADEITISYDVNTPGQQIENVKFADGTVWTHANLLAKVVPATDGADLLLGTAAGDTIHGLSGNDDIRGQGGDDSLYGDYGNDNLVEAQATISISAVRATIACKGILLNRPDRISS